jgi:hypothetical protein
VLLRDRGAMAVPEEKILAVTTVFSNGASFLARTNSTVAWTGTNDAWSYGSVAYGNLTLSNENLKTVRFEVAATNTVRQTLSIYQARLVSQTGGQWWYLTSLGSQTVSRVQVQDSNATNGLAIRVLGVGSSDLGNNVNWRFAGSTATLLMLR